MDTIDLLFPVLGSHIPTDHGYPLYSALAHESKCLHDGSVSFGTAPIAGLPIGNGLLQLDPARSRLRLRMAAANIVHVLALAGKRLNLMGCNIRLGVPSIYPLQPAPALIARMVMIKLASSKNVVPSPDEFLAGARRQLSLLVIRGTPRIPEHTGKEGQREPIRCVLRIKEKKMIGYSVLVEGMTPEDSVKLQEKGLGGRRHLGCGFFLPAHPEA